MKEVQPQHEEPLLKWPTIIFKTLSCLCKSCRFVRNLPCSNTHVRKSQIRSAGGASSCWWWSSTRDSDPPVMCPWRGSFGTFLAVSPFPERSPGQRWPSLFDSDKTSEWVQLLLPPTQQLLGKETSQSTGVSLNLIQIEETPSRNFREELILLKNKDPNRRSVPRVAREASNPVPLTRRGGRRSLHSEKQLLFSKQYGASSCDGGDIPSGELLRSGLAPSCLRGPLPVAEIYCCDLKPSVGQILRHPASSEAPGASLRSIIISEQEWLLYRFNRFACFSLFLFLILVIKDDAL